MAMRTISSGWTIFYKVLLPILWFFAFFFVVTELLFGDLTNSPPEPNAPPKFVIVLLFVIGTYFLWWGCIRLKRVRLNGKTIYISNYITEIAIPCKLIGEIIEHRWINTHPVTIKFSHDMGFGKTIIFMPEMRWIGWSKHPIVDELRQLAIAQHGGFKERERRRPSKIM